MVSELEYLVKELILDMKNSRNDGWVTEGARHQLEKLKKMIDEALSGNRE